ncbi:MAG: hypothetical protein INR73_22960 [Williamsia sp.]|nr:hypothetical protein [Williamsia sp.]
MKLLLNIALVIHIATGFLALVTGFISMLNTKGGKRHRLTGKLFFIGITGVFVSATIIAVAKGLAFLLMVGFFSYYLACSGYRSLYLKKLHLKQKPALLDWLISLVGVVAGAALVWFSMYWFRDRGAWGLVPLLFGLFCGISGIGDLKRFFVPPTNKLHWITTHGGRMGGSFAATLTAFIVVNVQIGALSWILWILPGLLVGVWITRLLRRYKVKAVVPESA